VVSLLGKGETQDARSARTRRIEEMRPTVSSMPENARHRIGTAMGGWRQNGQKVQQRKQGSLFRADCYALRIKMVKGGP
jgi:hypothetical protein